MKKVKFKQNVCSVCTTLQGIPELSAQQWEFFFTPVAVAVVVVSVCSFIVLLSHERQIERERTTEHTQI